MMTQDEYRAYYIHFITTILDPAVRRAAHNDPSLAANTELQANFENRKNGLVVLALVSLIESNFLTEDDLKQLRRFQTPKTVPPTVNTTHLSSFIYLRDCFAHNPMGILLSNGNNTKAFCDAVANGSFPWATISGQSVTIIPTGIHELHLNVLRFFGENV